MPDPPFSGLAVPPGVVAGVFGGIVFILAAWCGYCFYENSRERKDRRRSDDEERRNEFELRALNFERQRVVDTQVSRTLANTTTNESDTDLKYVSPYQTTTTAVSKGSDDETYHGSGFGGSVSDLKIVDAGPFTTSTTSGASTVGIPASEKGKGRASRYGGGNRHGFAQENMDDNGVNESGMMKESM